MAKGEKAKLPKMLGGFKLGRAIRKAEAVEELMSTAAGRALLEDAVTSAGAAAAAVLRRQEGRPKLVNGAAEESLARQDAAAFIATAVELFVTEARGILAPLPTKVEEAAPAPASAPAEPPALRRRAERPTAPVAAPAKTPRPRRAVAKAPPPKA